MKGTLKIMTKLMRKALAVALFVTGVTMIFGSCRGMADREIYMRKKELELGPKCQSFTNISTSEGPIIIELAKENEKLVITCPNGTITVVDWKAEEAPAEEKADDTETK